jgi:alpha-2-macroglobulin-like protein
MNESSPSNPVPRPNPNDSSPKAHRRQNALFWIVTGLVASGVLAVVVYSIYVGVHEPDRQETVVFGQTKMVEGSPAGLRIVVRDRISGTPIKGARVELSLLGKNASSIKLGNFQTDATGSLIDVINIPTMPPGEYQLVLDTISPLGRDHIVREVEVQHAARVLLSSDKPIYQPGQTIHLRSLLVNGRTQKTFSNETITFEVSDPKGNKVFKESRKSSDFGIASADFVLASELNLGRYEIRAIAGAATGERAVEITNYVLPKFKIHIATDKSYYLPGLTVSGSVQAGYFFGKPVSDGTVKLTAETIQEKPVAISELQGRTDNKGKFLFHFVLPDFLVGMPRNHEQALLDLTAEVADTAQQVEQTTLSLSVAKEELVVAAIPEAGVFVPGVENFLYVLTEYPDGRPAVCKVFVNGTAYSTDLQGACEIRMTPSDPNQQVEITALDPNGRKAKLTFQPDKTQMPPNLLIRADKAVYQAGQTAKITILSPMENNTLFVDAIKDGQTIFTKSTTLSHHQAQCSFDLPASLVGAIVVNAYVIDAKGEDRGCARVLYVNPASGLHIATKLSKPVYRPGEVAAIDFSVTDSQGHPAPAALGIAAVDESVFALQENHPGLLRQFFEAESDLLKPRYQIKFFDEPDQILFGARIYPGLAAAYLALLQPRPGGSGMDELVQHGDAVAQSLINELRQFEGTKEFEALRLDPQYAAAFRFLEGDRGLYSLREATGLLKAQAIEARRRAYFNRLQDCFELILPALFVSIPVCLLILLCVRAVKTGKPADVLIWLCIACLVMILASMLMPALARAKQKAQRVSLINTLKQVATEKQIMDSEGTDTQMAAQNPPRVRRDFPETLFWRPELITDDQGKATLEIPLADSITTWRASVDAISAAGKMGTIETPITVMQDFFADLDLPSSLSLGDEVSVPVTCYNYLKEPQDIHLHLAAADWFESNTQDLRVRLAANEVKSVAFPIQVLRVGHHALRVTAQGTKMADAVEREVRVVPTGERFEHTRNDVLKEFLADEFTVPAETIPDSQSLWIKLYPSRFSEIVEGLDSIFQQPYGCFEQTSSTTYPNVLALDYMKRTGRLTPELEVKARKFINTGYQRLLTFEVPGGGFEWFGQSPAHEGLTAYGILEFTDMSRVHPVDQAMIERTKQWLYSRQNADGSWNWSEGPHDWHADSPATAYVAWALAESGDESQALNKALGYLHSHPERLSNNYQKALAANAFLARYRNDPFGLELLEQLRAVAITEEKRMHWPSTGFSMTYSHDSGLEVETTALCTMAMIKAGTSPASVKQALSWLSKQKTTGGTWGSTQATILAMRALIQGSSTSLGQDFASAISVRLNGQTIDVLHINKDNSDVMQQVELTKHIRAGDNQIELRQSPPGELPVQVTGAFWLPARSSSDADLARPADPLQIDLQYDRTTLAVDDQLKCTVNVKNNTGTIINMAIVDLGIPPGFDVDSTSFEKMVESGRITKFELTGNQVILYLRELSNAAPLQFDYSLRAKYPLRVQAPRSAVYEYYQPTNRAESKAVVLRVDDSPTRL